MKKILIIVPDGGMLFESAGIADILMQANRLHPEGAREICYQVKLATTQPHQVIHGQSGLNLLADHRLHEIDPREPLDTIMITGRGQNPQEGMAVVDWLRLAAPHARRIVSICGGAMLLAQTGLLDGRRATTHWKLAGNHAGGIPADPRRGRAALYSGRTYLDLWRGQFRL
ncbi:Transcriptional regulator, AraC family [Klebsiella pneumoniae IS10]|nr:Transcriptional regulator, AraC family [Klebsiella pneumoniae IS10]